MKRVVVLGVGGAGKTRLAHAIAGLRTAWCADPWENVLILVEKVRRPDRPYYKQYE